MSFIFWIALLIQKSASISTEGNAFTTVAAVEHSNPSYESTILAYATSNGPLADFKEASPLTTSSNDIECSNNLDCINLRNLLTTLIPPGANYKVSWQPFTIKKVSTTTATSRVQDSSTQTTNEDVGNELDSEVNDMKVYFTPRTSISTEELNPTSQPSVQTVLGPSSLVSEISDEVHASNLIQEHSSTQISRDVSMQEMSTPFSEPITPSKSDDLTTFSSAKHQSKEGTESLMQDELSFSSPLARQPTSSDSTTSFSSSDYKDESSTILTTDAHRFDESIFTTTTRMPDFETSKTEYSDNFSEISSSSDLKALAIDETMHDSEPISFPIKILSEVSISDNATFESTEDFMTTNVSYTESTKIELNPNLVTESTIKDVGDLQLYSENVSDKEISEGHGLTRDLSYFLPSTVQPEMKTESKTSELSGLYSTKDPLTTMLLETTSTTELEKLALNEMTSSSIATFESASSLLNVSEQTFSTAEHSTYAADSSYFPTAYLGGISLDKDASSIGYQLPESRTYDEDISEGLISSDHTEMTVTTPEVSTTTNNTYTSVKIATVFPTDKPFYYPDLVEGITVTSNHTETDLTSILTSTQSTSEQAVKTSATSKDDYSTPSSTNVYITKEETVTTTFNSVDILVSTTLESDLKETIIDEQTDLSSSNSDYSPPISTNIYTTKEEMLTTTTSPVDLPRSATFKTYLTDTVGDKLSNKSFSELDNSTPSSTNIYTTERETAFYPVYLSASTTSETYPIDRSKESTTGPFSDSSSTTSVQYLSNDPIDMEGRMDKEAFDITTLKSQEPSVPETSTLSPTELSDSTDQDPIHTNVSDEASYQEYSVTSIYPESTTISTLFPKAPTTATSFDDSYGLIPTTKDLDNAIDSSTPAAYPPTQQFTDVFASTEPSAINIVTDSSILNIPYGSTLSTESPVVTSPTGTRREGKHIPFSTVAPSRKTDASTEDRITYVTDSLVENDYQQMGFDELAISEKANVITATILFSKSSDKSSVMFKTHNWLLRVLMKEFQNWTRDPFEVTNDQSRMSPFGNISIFYIYPTPELNSSGLTMMFVVYNVWKNETLQVDFVLGILNYYSKELKESINATAVRFYHGYVAEDHYLMSAILEKYGIIIVTISLAVILILILICVVVVYRKKTRRSVHCLSNSKFKQNISEAVGIDLTPAVIILQDEKSDKVGNGNNICDDEGWLAPINEVPQAEDTNVPIVQDTKL